MAILPPLKKLSEWFLILAMLYLSIDGMCVLTTIISDNGGKEREIVEGLMSILVTISLAVSLGFKFALRMSKTLLEYFVHSLSFYTLLGLSFLGNQERTTLIIAIYLAVNTVFFIVQKLILRKNLKLNNLSTNKLVNKGGH
ncbi:hypothetical protein [Lysinibacillus fusiformis]|uniref:Uncharacterized protein n=1 Tax=Lysinibacillus fusiformis TaxID=28031 RepID=A0A1H9SED5_9BACI|nr:hypothetical protein [Lysinibacillus fusiformis]SCY83809.1 hypothetical protein SAMN02787081_04694 [Lysinibacillus fusiformis]SEO53444.1 hypothetical protein SAMN02787103_04667 [Lysinibacillus fusiformis]SER83400.1 hypothetical protein SAMN02787113_04699 [Lysinibacillus fusiformis]